MKNAPDEPAPTIFKENGFQIPNLKDWGRNNSSKVTRWRIFEVKILQKWQVVEYGSEKWNKSHRLDDLVPKNGTKVIV